MNLGIVLDAKGDIKNHRSLLKVVLNPVLRYLGWCIGSPIIEDEERTFVGFAMPELFSCDRTTSIKWEPYELGPGEFLIEKRRLV